MTLAATDTIDLILLTRDRRTLKLVIVATENLTDGPQVNQLRNKLLSYRDAIRSGKFNEIYPQYAALRKMIQVDHYSPLGAQAEQVLTECAREFRSDSLSVVSNQCSANPLRIVLNLFRGGQSREWTA
jgi:hypothetical protein